MRRDPAGNLAPRVLGAPAADLIIVSYPGRARSAVPCVARWLRVAHAQPSPQSRPHRQASDLLAPVMTSALIIFAIAALSVEQGEHRSPARPIQPADPALCQSERSKSSSPRPRCLSTCRRRCRVLSLRRVRLCSGEHRAFELDPPRQPSRKSARPALRPSLPLTASHGRPWPARRA
jgi:hypothetical protein